jgi:hypothetical protein
MRGSVEAWKRGGEQSSLVCGPPSVVRRLWSTVCGPPSVVHRLRSAVCGPPSAVLLRFLLLGEAQEAGFYFLGDLAAMTA